jgi:hypothetical protein
MTFCDVFCYFFSCVDVPFSWSHSPPPQECLPSGRTKSAETAILMDLHTNCEVETKKVTI